MVIEMPGRDAQSWLAKIANQIRQQKFMILTVYISDSKLILGSLTHNTPLLIQRCPKT